MVIENEALSNLTLDSFMISIRFRANEKVKVKTVMCYPCNQPTLLSKTPNL